MRSSGAAEAGAPAAEASEERSEERRSLGSQSTAHLVRVGDRVRDRVRVRVRVRDRVRIRIRVRVRVTKHGAPRLGFLGRVGGQPVGARADHKVERVHAVGRVAVAGPHDAVALAEGHRAPLSIRGDTGCAGGVMVV